jgi:hypothetical protein
MADCPPDDSVRSRPSGERRRWIRGSPGAEPARARLVAMIMATYRELYGLSLDLNEASRLFGLREATCRVVLDDLVTEGRLRRSPDGRYRVP